MFLVLFGIVQLVSYSNKHEASPLLLECVYFEISNGTI